MARLKSETMELHKQIESRVDLMSMTESRPSYALALAKFFGFYQPVECGLRQLDWQRAGFDLSPRMKTDWISESLTCLDATIQTTDIPRCRHLPPLTSIAEGIGCLYVLEGSTLGGQFILRALQERLGLSPNREARFFASYGKHVGSMWKSFGSFAEQYAATHPADQEMIIASAQTTFVAFGEWFQPITKVSETDAC